MTKRNDAFNTAFLESDAKKKLDNGDYQGVSIASIVESCFASGYVEGLTASLTVTKAKAPVDKSFIGSGGKKIPEAQPDRDSSLPIWKARKIGKRKLAAGQIERE